MNIIKLRLKRIKFAIKYYKFLKKCWGIKYPIINALIGEIKNVNN